SFKEGRLQVPRQLTAPPNILWRRVYVFGTTALMTLTASAMMAQVLAKGGVNVLEVCLLALFVLLFAWVALSFVGSLAGLQALLRGRRKLGIYPDTPLPTLQTRTALLMPTYNEDPRRMMAGLQAIYESVAATGELENFDFFVLSDTTRDAIGRAEEQVFARLVQATDGAGRLFYRRRASNVGRKAGNIA